jgi:hypothetical protein
LLVVVGRLLLLCCLGGLFLPDYLCGLVDCKKKWHIE